MKAKLSPNLISFVSVRRGDWITKVSVFKNNSVLVVAQNYYATEQVIIKHFTDKDKAATFIDNLIIEE